VSGRIACCFRTDIHFAAVVCLTGTPMNLCLCLASMQTVRIESLRMNLSIRDCIAEEFICTGHRCHILEYEIVRDF